MPWHVISWSVISSEGLCGKLPSSCSPAWGNLGRFWMVVHRFRWIRWIRWRIPRGHRCIVKKQCSGRFFPENDGQNGPWIPRTPKIPRNPKHPRNPMMNSGWWILDDDFFARTVFGKIDLAKNLSVAFDDFFNEENVATKSRREMLNNPGQQKNMSEAQPETPANSYNKPIQNSKQQRSRRKRRSPQKWGGALRAPHHFWGCFEIWIDFL